MNSDLWYTEDYTDDVRFSYRVTDLLLRKQTRYQLLEIYETPEFGRLMLLDGKVMVTDRDEHIYHEMLVYDYLDYVADIRGVEKGKKLDHLRELADLCSLNEVMHFTISELSKGYRQRVGIAHALMGDPEILVLDEPTAGLDPNQIVETRDIIRRIGKEKTIIFSTHILSEAEATCDRVVIIDRGKIVADDTIDGLRENLKIKSFEKIFRNLTRGH